MVVFYEKPQQYVIARLEGTWQSSLLCTEKPLHGLRLLRFAPEKIDGFCSGRIEIAAVAVLLRNDIGGLFSFLCILRIRSGARNDRLKPDAL